MKKPRKLKKKHIRQGGMKLKDKHEAEVGRKLAKTMERKSREKREKLNVVD